MIQATVLSQRGLVKLSGPDVLPFLQGLVTNDVSGVSPTRSLYAWLLTPQGKYLYDLIISQSGEDWYIEVDRQRLDEFVRRLSLYVLRSQVTITPVPEKQVVALWVSTEHEDHHIAEALELPFDRGATNETSLWTAMVDPRVPALGARLYLSSSENTERLTECLGVQIVPEDHYQYHRLSMGIPESCHELMIDKSIPLECGLEDMGGVDWQKGCYIGQELTARTKYRGLVRKRLLPFTLSVPVELDDSILTEDKDVGKWYAVTHDKGLGLVRLEAVSSPLLSNEGRVIVHLPDWIRLPKVQE